MAVYLLHYIPAILMDLVSILQGGKRKMVLPIAKKFRQACLAGKCLTTRMKEMLLLMELISGRQMFFSKRMDIFEWQPLLLCRYCE